MIPNPPPRGRHAWWMIAIASACAAAAPTVPRIAISVDHHVGLDVAIAGIGLSVRLSVR